jgi:outer membrane lipoprotein
MNFHILPYFLLCSLLLLGACTGMPPDLRDFSATTVPYQLINQNINAYKDTPIRWGGTVITIENEADSSLMQVLFYPLNRHGYPQTNQAGKGRFAVQTSEFLDPAIFAKGTEVTVTGTIKEGIEHTVGNKIIHIPLVIAQTIHLWPISYREDNLYWNSRYRYGPYPSYYGYPFFYRWHYDPYYYWW